MKVSLEVSNLIAPVNGPQGAVAYRVGTRNATTSLRLRDGETQILAGLINDEDRKSVQGLPGVSELPVIGRLFGVHKDTRDKSEVVLLITPRVVRNLGLPDAATLSGPAGSYTSPGAATTRIRSSAKVTLAIVNGAIDAEPVAPKRASRAAGSQEETSATLEISTTGNVAVGETVSVTLQNHSTSAVRGQLGFDTALLQSASGEAGGLLDFTLEPSGQKVFVLRALAGAAGKNSQIQLDAMSATSPAGASLPVKLEGDANVTFTSAESR